MAGPTVRRAAAPGQSAVCGRRDSLAGAGNRRQHRDFSIDRCRAAARATGKESPGNREDCHRSSQRGERKLQHPLPGLDLCDVGADSKAAARLLGSFAWGPNIFNIAPGGEVHNVQGLWVSGEFFETLGIRPVLGRLLTTKDDQPGCGSPGVAISYSFWQHEYGGDRSVLERTLTINRQPFQIIGVAPPEFTGVEVGRYFDVAVPLSSEPLVNGEYSQLKRRSGWWLSVLGRLKPGWSIERAAAQSRAISQGLF
jgi:hypothetical protein